MTKDCRHNTLGHFPLHPSQEGIYFEQLIKPESPAYNIGGYIKIDGRLDVELFKKALYLVIDGLDAFGLSFDCNDSISEQSVKPKEMRTKDLDIADLSGEKDPVKQALDQLHQIFSEPFSLQSDCLYINKLLKVQNEEFWWVLKAHHIIVDGYGYAHFSRQVAKAYSCLLYGEPLDWLDDLPSYQEATLNALRYMESAQYHKDKAFWLKRYESLPDPLLDTNSSKQGLSGVQHCEMTLPRDLTQSIRKSCSDLNVSIQQLSLAALSIYYFKSAGAKRLCFGIPLLSRHNRQERQTVGMMTDIIPSLVEISDENQEVSGFIRSISAQQKQEYRHRRFPLTHLKRALNRATGTSGIFNVLVNYEPFDVDLEMGSLKSNFHHCSAPEDSVPLQFRWGDYSDMGQLTLKVTYKPECFTQDEIDLQIERHFSILKYLSQNPSSAISTVPTLSPGEQGLLQNWNNTQQDFPDELCIHQLVEARAAEHPEATALVFNNESLGYGELNQRANQLAHYLLEQGVRPDTLVGLCADRSFEMMIGLLGILKAGGAYVPLDPSYPSERLGHMIQDSGVDVIITQQHLIHDLPNGSAQESYRAIALDCSEVQQQLSHYTEENIDPTLIGLTSRHLAYVIYTSGSTGKPKGVMLQHDGLVSLAYHQGASFGISNISRVLQFASLSFDAAVWEWVLTLSVGARFYLYSREAILNPERLSIEVADAGITHAMLTPAFLPHLDSSLWESVQTLIVGGDKCALELAQAWSAECRFFNAYGPTEATIDCCVFEYKGSPSVLPIGRPITNVEVYVLSPEQQLVPIGVPGELYVGGVGLARGYLNRPDLTADKFIAHPFSDDPEARLYRTGDLVRWLPDGNLAFLGRLDHQVKIRGFRIELGEIESELLCEPSVKEAVVLAREDRSGDKRLVAYVTASEMPEALDEDALIESLKQRLKAVLPDYMVPSAFVVLEQLPLTPNGKVDRKALPEPDLAQLTGVYEAPQSPTEARLAELWQTLLQLNSPVSRDAHFFELGGHSLLGVRLLAAIREQFALDIPIKTLFAQPILSELAAALDVEVSMAGQGIQVPPMVARDPQLTALPLSYAQQRLWFIDRLEGGSVHYNMPGALRLSGKLDIAALEQSFKALYHRHESLRTCFVEQATGETYQQVQAAPTGQCLPVVDLQTLSADEQTAALMAHRRELSAWPFDLTQDLMLQLRLLRLSVDESVLLLTLHHIAGDGWSISLLIQELQALYSAYVADTTPQLTPLSIQYADYALWQHDYLQGEVLAQQTQYWEHQLAGLPDAHALPLDYPRPAQQSFAGANLSTRIPSALSQQLQDYCMAEGATLFMGLHALFSALVSRYSNETDIVVGSPVANREQPEIAPLIGFFVNTLVLRADLSEAPNFNTLLTQCRATALDAYAHQQVPFEQLVEVLQPNRHLSHHPLFQVMLALQNNETAELTLPGVEVQFEAADLTIAKFDLTLNVEQDANGLALDWEYNQDLFKAETVARLARHFEALLQAALTQPERPLVELDILTAEEKQQQLVEWNDTQQAFPSELCIHQLVEAQAAEQPDATALVFNHESLSYGELNQRANQLAHYLLEQGVRPDTLVGLCADRSFEMMIGLLGILKAGGAYVPLDPSYPSERLGHMIQDSGVGVIITQRHLIDSLPTGTIQASYRTIALDCSEVQQQLSHYTEENIDPALIGLTSRHLAYVIYTSGSTGKPKGVLVEHRGVINAASDQVQRFDVTRTSRIGQIAAISFDTSVLDWSLALSTGAALYLYPHDVILSPSELSNRVAQDLLTHCILTPALLPHLDSSLWESVQTLVVGGDKCALEVAQAWSEKRRFFNAYGPTEATIDCCVFEYKGSPSVLPIGRPITNVEVYVLSPEQQLVPIGVPGELYVGGVGLTRGYLNRPELTAEKFIAHPFSDDPEARLYRTGDLVRWLPGGNLAFLGRLDHQVKIRGFRVELGEIESQLLREPSVKEAVVVAREDRCGDKRLVAYVTANQTPEVLDATEETMMDSLRQGLKAVLPEYMVPSAFVVLEQLPLTPSGKVDRKALPEPTYSDTSQDYVLPSTALETELTVLWSDVLGVEHISIHANFFSLGGDSIKAIQVASQGQKQGLPLTTKQLFQHQTIAELALHLDIHAETAQIPQSSVKGVQSLLPIQHHFLSTQPAEASQHFNQAVRFELPKDTQEAALRSLLTALLQRHDALRLSFIQTEGQWQGYYSEVDEAVLQKVLVSFEHQGEPEAESHIQSIANQLHSSFDLAQAPLMRCLWVRNSVSGAQELIWIIHHLVVDGVSWRILLEDLQEGLPQYQSQENVSIQLGPKTHSLQYWSERLEAYSATEACLSTLPYWQKTVQSSSINLLERSSIISTHTFTQSDSQVEQICLSATRTEQLLQGIHDCYHTQINDILLAALVLAVGEWAAVDSDMSKHGLRLDLEGHGREPLFEDVDLTQTLGWFTSVFPLHLPFSLLSDSENAHEQLVLEACIKGVKERLRAIPNKGMDYGILQRYQQARLPQTGSSQLVFNYLGVFEKGFAGDSGQALASNLLREHALGFNSYVVDGQWTLNIDYHPQQFTTEDINALAKSYQQALEKLINHCLQAPGSYTPSDFPLLSLTQTQVDHLQTEYPYLEDLYPSTAMQQGLLFHSSLDPDNGQYETQLKFKLTDLDSNRFKESWEQLVADHAIFRTAFATIEGQNQIQVVNAHAHLPWHQYDWRRFSADQQQQQLQNLLDQGHCSAPEQAPLMSGHLAQIGEKEYWFVWQHHHALLDGWCLPIVFKELMVRYQALAMQSAPKLPAARPYKDYIAWLGRQDQNTAEHYWRTYLEGFSEPTQIQIGDPQASGSSCSQECHLTLSRELTQQLEHQAQQHQVSLNLWLQLGWGLLLSHYSGSQDIVFGSTRSGRPSSLPGVEDMLGLFINSLPVRLKLSSTTQLQAALSQLKQAQTDQEDFSFTPLVDVQRWSDIPAGRELFDSLMVFENYPVDEALADGLVQGSSNSPLNNDRLRISEFQGVESTHYPLTLSVSPGDSLHLKLMFSEPKFNQNQIRQLLQHLEALLQGLAHSKADTPLASITLLSAEEKQQQLVEWNDTQQAFPDELCIHQLFEAQAAEQPDATALVLNHESLSYGELNQRANQVAHYLLEQGVRPDTLVGLCADRSFEMMIGILGILKAGGAYVPLDPSYPSERLGHMIQDSDVGVIITQQHLIHDLPNGSAQASYRAIALDCSEVQQQLSHYTEENIDPALIGLTSRHLAYVIYTSGSTGKPKGVLVEHRGVINAASDQVQRFDVTRTSRIGQIAAISFDTSVLDWSLALSTGAALYLYPHDVILSPSELSNRVAQDLLTHCILTPALLPHLDSSLWESVQTLIVGGDKCALELAQAWSAERRFFNAYGPTEATIDCCVFEYKGSPSVLPIGRPITNVEVYVLSPEQQLVPIGVPGELCIGGVGLARGYLNRPDLTADKFIAHPFSDDPEARLYRTGDLVRWLPDGNLAFLGRLDHQVKIRGFRIELGEIESELLCEPSVKEAVVLAREDRSGDKRLVAYVTASEMPEALDEDALIESLKQRLKAVLPDYMVPSAFVVLEQLPLTPNGKVDRKALPEPDLAQLTGVYEAPQSPTEARLAELWQTLLQLNSPVSRDAHFFELGGHSLLAMKLVAAINDTFSTHLLIKTIFSNSYLHQLAEQIDNQHSKENVWQPLVEMHSNDESMKSLPIVYAVPGAGGSSAAYQALAKALEPYAKVVVLEPKGIAGDQAPHKNWAEMLDEYTEEIQRYQPNGPHWLLGHSYGGRVAFEIAIRLEAQNKEVSCILLDAELCGVMAEDMPEDTLSTEEKVLSVMQEFLDVTVSPLGSLSQEQAKAELIQLMTTAGLISQERGTRQVEAILEIYNTQEEISINYRASQSIDGPLTLLYSKESFSQESLLKVHESHGKLSQKGFSCYPVEGTHVSMLRPQHVHSIANSVRDLIHAKSDGAIME